jgi:hypothetical protein
MVGLDIALDDQDRTADALPYFERAITIIEVGAGVNSPGLITPLERPAKIYRDLDREADARAIDNRVQAILQSKRN